MTAAAATHPAVDARQRLAAVRSILGGAPHDPLGAVWDIRASEKDRRLLLAMGGASQFEAARWKSAGWSDLPAATRGDIRRGLARFRDWASRLEGDS